LERQSAPEIVFVKQQGAMRTGTNLVKFALEENFTNVRVLVNIGRWKHAPADRPFNWLGTSWEGDGIDIDVARRIGPEDLAAVRDAVDRGALRYAISVRNVYAWLVSYLRFEHWYDDPPLRHLSDLPRDEIVGAIQRWNVLYQSYLDVLATDPCSTAFRLEDLVASFDQTLDRTGSSWGLRRRHQRYVRPERYLRAGVDGQSRSELFESLPFEPSQSVTEAYAGQLDAGLLALVNNTVDERLVRAFGYELLCELA
jgi:hypothetical protein